MAVVEASWCFNQRKVLMPIVLFIVAECLFTSILKTIAAEHTDTNP